MLIVLSIWNILSTNGLCFPVKVSNPEDALIYQPQQSSHTYVSCDDDVSPLKQRYIDLLKQGELASYCTKFPNKCVLNNVEISCV